jgi:hypothetical protein
MIQSGKRYCSEIFDSAYCLGAEQEYHNIRLVSLADVQQEILEKRWKSENGDGPQIPVPVLIEYLPAIFDAAIVVNALGFNAFGTPSEGEWPVVKKRTWVRRNGRWRLFCPDETDSMATPTNLFINHWAYYEDRKYQDYQYSPGMNLDPPEEYNAVTTVMFDA